MAEAKLQRKSQKSLRRRCLSRPPPPNYILELATATFSRPFVHLRRRKSQIRAEEQGEEPEERVSHAGAAAHLPHLNLHSLKWEKKTRLPIFDSAEIRAAEVLKARLPFSQKCFIYLFTHFQLGDAAHPRGLQRVEPAPRRHRDFVTLPFSLPPLRFVVSPASDTPRVKRDSMPDSSEHKSCSPKKKKVSDIFIRNFCDLSPLDIL